MVSDPITLKVYFAQLGLAPEAADVYLLLFDSGPQNKFSLSRHTGIERNRLYRIIDSLVAHNLVETDVRHQQRLIKAAPLANLEIVFAKKAQDLLDLQNQLSQVYTQFNQPGSTTAPMRVEFYYKPEGIKQMMWNETRGTTENLAILYENMQRRTGEAFFDRWVARCNERGLRFRSLVNDAFIESQKAWYKQHTNARLDHWVGRHMPAHIFSIVQATVIYDTVVAHFLWNDTTALGFEIYSVEIATTYRQFFAMLWAQSLPISLFR